MERHFVEEDIADVFPHYFLKVRRGQRMKGLLGFCSSNGKSLLGFKRGSSMT